MRLACTRSANDVTADVRLHSRQTASLSVVAKAVVLSPSFRPSVYLPDSQGGPSYLSLYLS